MDNRLANRRGTNKQKEPREGTRLRELWDLFQANKGQPLAYSCTNRTGTGNNRRLDDLRDYYGLDIRPAGRGFWVLAGQWFGDEYVNYTKA